MTRRSACDAPVLRLDRYEDAVLRDSRAAFASVRDTGPAVWLGWGNGPHTRVGIHLAKLEMQALVRAMVPRVEAIHTGTPERLLNNTLQGISRLPARLIPA
jgi:cytochrome P450